MARVLGPRPSTGETWMESQAGPAQGPDRRSSSSPGRSACVHHHQQWQPRGPGGRFLLLEPCPLVASRAPPCSPGPLLAPPFLHPHLTPSGALGPPLSSACSSCLGRDPRGLLALETLFRHGVPLVSLFLM